MAANGRGAVDREQARANRERAARERHQDEVDRASSSSLGVSGVSERS
jgi:hypothetical protein